MKHFLEIDNEVVILSNGWIQGFFLGCMQPETTKKNFFAIKGIKI
jgi:hypothetical protein